MSEPCKHCWHSTGGAIWTGGSSDDGNCCHCGEPYRRKTKYKKSERRVIEHGPHRPSWVPEKEVV